MKSRTFLARLVLMIIGIFWLLPGMTVQSQNPEPESPAAWDVAWSPDGSTLAVSGNFGVALYSESFQLTEILTVEPTRALAWSPDGTQLVTAASNFSDGVGISVISIWDTKANPSSLIRTMSVPQGFVRWLSWSADNRRFSAATFYEGVYVYDINDPIQTPTFTLAFTTPGPDTHEIAGAAWSPNGLHIAAIARPRREGESAFLNVWDAAGALDFSIDLTATARMGSIATMAWSPDSANIALAGSSRYGAITFLDVATQTFSQAFIRPIGGITFMSWSPDGSRFAASDDGNTGSSLFLWSISTYHQSWVQSFSDSSGISYVGGAWKPDGSQLVMTTRTFAGGAEQSTVQILDPADGSIITELILPTVNPTPPTPTVTSTPE